MEVIKRTISLEPLIDRGTRSPTYGTITATSVYINIQLTQNFEDGGIFTDAVYIPKNIGINAPPDYTVLTNKLLASGFTFPFMTGKTPKTALSALSYQFRVTGLTVSDYFYFPNMIITGITDSRLYDNRTYDQNNPLVLNFDTNEEIYMDVSGNTVDGVDRVTYLGNPIIYVFGADKNDLFIGTLQQKNGLVFQDQSGTSIASFSFAAEGFNMTNIVLSALTKEEYLFGVTAQPEVQSDLFIDRGITPVFERHLKLSEITNLAELQRYGRGYYNLTTQ